ncbi:MAG: caspase family protein [Alphaproteobacteria bacterium]|nr:caspase family protein [Alphaproteobacteria bacterium]
MPSPARRLLVAAIALLAVAGEAAAQAAPDRRVALVIGNGKYEAAAALPNPPNDARLIASTLKGLGFELVDDAALIDLDKAKLEAAIRRFGQKLAGSAAGLFYYAGHGIQLRGTNYLIPTGARLEREADVKYELVDANFILDEMGSAGTKLNVMILDACRNNPFGGRGLRSVQSGLAQMQAPSGTIIGYATQPGAVALDGSGRVGPYASALAAAMRMPGMRVLETFNEVGVRVQKQTGGQQQPWLATSPIEGQFFFAPPAAAPTVAAAPAPASDPASRPPALIAVDQEFVTTGNANVRAQPSTDSEKVAALPAGTIVAATGKTKVAGKDWFRVERDGRNLGYVIGDLLESPPTKSAPQLAAAPAASPVTRPAAPAPAVPAVATPPAATPSAAKPAAAPAAMPTLAPLVLPAGRRPSVDDAEALPLDKDKAIAGYRDFLREGAPRAFAISVTGAWGWRSGVGARNAVLEACNRASKARCQLYAVDDRVVIPIFPEAAAYLDEATDFGVAPTAELRVSDFEGATPLTVPGARTIRTGELHAALQRPDRPILVDVLDMEGHRALPSAFWLRKAGSTIGKSAEVQGRFVRAVERLAGGDRARPVAVYCLSAWCWESYNAALLLARQGFTGVMWYRGGTRSWLAAGLPVEATKPTNW